MTIFDFLMLFSAVLIGGIAALRIGQKNAKAYLGLFLSFSGAYLLGITAVHLLPETFNPPNHSIGFWILGGFLLQLVLEMLSKGIEHGHVHPNSSVSKTFIFPIMLGLCIHAFIEGMPLDAIHQHHHHLHEEHHHQPLLYGIIFHKIPAAFSLGLLLSLSGFRRTTAILFLVLFGLMSPLGAFVGSQLALSTDQFQNLMGLVIGTFLHISTTILFEADEKSHHRISFKKLAAILVGLALAILTIY